ncbi:MAG: pilus assembly protein TadG-related protein [Sphingomonadales bacterium]|jgi:Flp pilus assembly protein TadG
MPSKHISAKKRGFLASLCADQSGNTIAMTAAATFVLMGIVGSAVDMSRSYAVKSRLQSACDASVLAGLKVVDGNWTEDTDQKASAAAEQMFNANFKSDAWGAKNVTGSFTPESKTATADVPMTIMQLFGREKSVISVECSGELQLPNADVMFVLDTTGSMDSVIPGDPSNTLKIDGLRVGVNCFYEILARQDNPAVTNAQCDYDAGEEPWNSEIDESIQLRFGFVPYSQMVNVGRLLRPEMMVDVANYQTRVPNLTTQQTWTNGTATPVSWNNDWTPAGIPSSYYTRQSSTGFTDQTTNAATEQGTLAPRLTSVTSNSQCNSQNNLSGSGSQLVALSLSGGSLTTSGGTSWTPAAPVHPQGQQSAISTQSQTITVTQWRYIWETRSSVTGCFLERRNHSSTYLRSQNGSSTRPVIWTERQVVSSWTYRQNPVDVSTLKNANGGFNADITLPLNETTINNVRLSGQSGTTSIRVIAPRTITWHGCIEERQTVRVPNGTTPADHWSPVPEDALDMRYDIAFNQNNDATRWRFALRDLVWGRTSGGSRTTASVVGNASMATNFSWACPVPARKLDKYTSEDLNGDNVSDGAKSFADYVATLDPGGNTYHDIGLLWGARLLSPNGVFGSQNKVAPNGGPINRHIVFMTDGETVNSATNYTSYGLDWYDRRQTDPGSAPLNSLLQANNDARSNALCTAIKNENIELWVIYYGYADNSTYTRLKNCATDDKHFVEAQSTSNLVKAFKEIAKSIADLQLTS